MILFHIELNETEIISYLNELTDAHTHYGFGNYKGKVTSAVTAMNADTMDVFIENKSLDLYCFQTVINGTATVQNEISLSALYMLLTYMFGTDVLRYRIAPINKQELIQSIKGQTNLHLSMRRLAESWSLEVELITM